MPSRFLHSPNPSSPPQSPGLFFVFKNDELLLNAGQIPHGTAQSLGLEVPYIHIGILDQQDCFAAELPSDSPVPEGWQAQSIRSLFAFFDEATVGVIGYAAQIIYWQRTSRFCGVCGSPRGPLGRDMARTCTGCGHTSYPRVSPAVLVLIHDGDKILLAQKPGWGKRYSIIAGFVDPNESLEDCVRRETQEEVGLEVDSLHYLGSQPWPFPHQLMVAFSARYVGGKIKLEEDELSDAQWFSPDNLPELPPPISLSRQVIDAWLAASSQSG